MHHGVGGISIRRFTVVICWRGICRKLWDSEGGKLGCDELKGMLDCKKGLTMLLDGLIGLLECCILSLERCLLLLELLREGIKLGGDGFNLGVEGSNLIGNGRLGVVDFFVACVCATDNGINTRANGRELGVG